MTQAKQRFLSFDEYLSYDDGTGKLYELFNIVDPQQSAILILMLAGDRFSEWRTFQGSELVESSRFGTLNCTADQIFAAAR